MVIVTTSGLNIYTHSCGCCQSFDVSVNAFDECCDQIETQTCEMPQEGQAECCEEPARHSNSDHVCSQNGCCEYEHNFLKFSEKFNKPAQVSFHHFDQIAAVTELYLNDFDQCKEIESDFILNHSLPPPLLTGKAFVIFTHSFKIAPSFIISA